MSISWRLQLDMPGKMPKFTQICVLFWTKFAVPRPIKPGILKLTIRRGQSNLSIVFIFVSFEKKGYYRDHYCPHSVRQFSR